MSNFTASIYLVTFSRIYRERERERWGEGGFSFHVQDRHQSFHQSLYAVYVTYLVSIYIFLRSVLVNLYVITFVCLWRRKAVVNGLVIYIGDMYMRVIARCSVK